MRLLPLRSCQRRHCAAFFCVRQIGFMAAKVYSDSRTYARDCRARRNLVAKVAAAWLPYHVHAATSSHIFSPRFHSCFHTTMSSSTARFSPR